jgi:branched-chain amino acid aminotransferase
MKTGEQDCEKVWVNGNVTRPSEAMISVSAPGLTSGLGCFETMCVEKCRFFRFSKHYDRLICGARKVTMTPPLVDDLRLAILELIEINGYQSSSCRVRVSCYLEGDVTTTVITTSAMPVREVTSSTVLSPYRVNEYSALAGVKSSSYAMNLIALREAELLDADEALMLNTKGVLCEGATSNLFLVKKGEVFTPHLESGCLPGVAREAVIELCKELDIPCFECALSLADLHDCDGAFLTSSLRRIHPITSLDGNAVKIAGTVAKLQSAYAAKVYGSE